MFFSGSYEEKCKIAENVTYSDQENINYTYGSSCNKLLTTESLGTAYEDSCNTKSLCLYKDLNYDLCKTVESEEETQEFLNQVENNNFNISFSNQPDAQYASCSNHNNISMISSACYNNTASINYTNVNYNTIYPVKDMNKNYEEVCKIILKKMLISDLLICSIYNRNAQKPIMRTNMMLL